MDKCKAFALFLASIVGFPFIFLLIVVYLLLRIPIETIKGGLRVSYVLWKYFPNCCGHCCKCCCFIILVPFVMISGAITVPRFTLITLERVAETMKKYCHSLEFFKEQLIAWMWGFCKFCWWIWSVLLLFYLLIFLNLIITLFVIL